MNDTFLSAAFGQLANNSSIVWLMPANLTSSEKDGLVSGILSEEFSRYATQVVYVGMNGCMSLLGIVFNITNILVFWKLGFGEVVNISLFALAVSDLGVGVTAFLQSIFYNIWINDWVQHINFRHVQYLFAAYPRGMFARTSSFLTAFVCFERCLCVLLPLKVKTILTKRVSILVIACINVPVVVSFVIPYICMWLAPKYSDTLNMTVTSLYYRQGQSSVRLEEGFILVISLYQIIAFFLVILFTVLLVLKMQQKNKWREKTVTAGQKETMATKDNKVIKMVVVICGNFIISFTPAVLQLIAMFAVSNYGISGPYRRMYVFMWSVCTFGEVICSAVNIFFYYRMSSKYAAILNGMLGLAKGT